MKKETCFGTVEYGGEYVSSPYSPIDTADTAPGQLPIATPYLAHALVRTAKLWSFLHASAPLAARRYLVGRVADALGVEVTGGIW
ncbi:hypothetical protein HK23_14190 [Acetobacter malorum]|uniref:Uncharacterized protein n=1 Tax=Acetobacter malorum TaxID=178901 RepID=A0A1Y3GA51_9PROT|nr:hypothetical protein HK23_14190 [Acetobacter malorum]